MILAPHAAMLVQMAISRTREFEADRERRRDFRPAAVARLGARAHRARRASASRTRRPKPIRRPRICSSSTRCHGGNCGLFSHPSADGRAHRAAERDGRTRWARRRRRANRPVGAGRRRRQELTAPGLPARTPRSPSFPTVLRRRVPLDVARRRSAGSGQAGAARCRLRPRHRGRHVAPLRTARALVRGFVPKPPPPHKAGADARNPARGRLRASVPERAGACGRRCRQPPGRADGKAVHFKAADQCRAAAHGARRRGHVAAQDAGA